jgi:CDP-diacylglycerol--glycerol-3-phosphate 3-phosphatidyltransferase
MAANIITLARIGLAFVAIGLFATNFYGQFLAFLFTIIAIYMDALDGYVARRLGVASELGALLDITGDRIVENIYWIYFAAIGTVSFWIPMVVIARGFLTDTVRSVAFSEGKTPFGEKTMMQPGITRFLVASRFSRGLYGVSKAVIFCYLGGLIVLRGAMTEFSFLLSPRLLYGLDLFGQVLVYIVTDVVRPAVHFIASFLRSWVMATRGNKYYLKGKDSERIRQLTEECFQAEIVPLISDPARRKIEEHRADGMDIVLLSGTLDVLLRCFQQHLKADHAHGSTPRVVNGCSTGEVEGVHPYGNGKAEIVLTHYGGSSYDLSSSYAYADRISDLPLLRLFGHPAFVNPNARMRAKAKALGIEIARF